MPTSGKNLAKEFQRIGYELVPGGGKGSHMKLQKAGCPTVTIPHHKELRPGTEHTLRKILEMCKKGK